MSEAPPPTSALIVYVQSASTLLLSALIPTHLTTFHITSYWGAVLLPRFCSSQYVMWLFLPDHIRLNCWRLLGFKNQVSSPLYFISLQSIYWDLFWFLCIYFAKQSECFFINSLGNSQNFWHYQWPEEFIKQKKPASKWHQIALYERWMCFVYFSVQTTVLFWNPLYYYWDIVKKNDHHHIWMPKNRYLGTTGVTKKLHKSIAKLNYEFNNSKNRCEG